MDILLAEDDLIFGESLKNFLETEGFKIYWAKDGQIALDNAKLKQFDLYLFDINMPMIDGFELLKKIRSYADKTPTIFITAKDDTKSVVEGLKIGAEDYIKKPFDTDELLARIDKLVDRNTTIRYDKILFDTTTKVLKIDGMTIHLSPNEHKLFVMLITNIDTPIDTTQLNIAKNTIALYVSKFRKLGLRICFVKTGIYMCESFNSLIPVRKKRKK